MIHVIERKITMSILLPLIFVVTSVCSNDVQVKKMTLERWIKLGMNLHINPCFDLYSYACGSWYLNSKNVGYAEKFNYFVISERSMVTQAIAFLMEKASDMDDICLRKEKQWFNSCLNINSKISGYYKFRKILNETGGFLPMKDGSSNITEKKWQTVASYYASEFAESVFFVIGLNKDNLLKLDKPLTWNDKFFDKTYTNLLKDVELVQTKYISEEIYKNQTTMNVYLTNFTMLMIEITKNEREDMKIMTIQQFQKQYDSFSPKLINTQINWLEYLQKIMQNSGKTLKYSDKIEVNLFYFQCLHVVLTTSPNEIIVNYIHFMTITHQYRNLFISLDFLHLTNSEKKYICFDRMPIQDGVTAAIVQKKLGEKNDWVKNLFEKLRELHIEEVENSHLSNSSKNTARALLENLSFRWQGYTNFYNSGKLSYEFNITSSTFQNIINFNKAQMKHKMEMYINRASIQRTKRRVEAPSFYTVRTNEISVTPLLLLLPVFNLSAPIFWNLGNIAFILSHEISRAVVKAAVVDTEGQAKSEFAKKVHCFKNQFKEYRVNGENMFEQSIADYQGMKVAFNLLKLISKGSISPDERIGGLHFDAQKLFFISLATTFCENPADFPNRQEMIYPPIWMRINKAAGNLVAFAEAFDCPVNSLMNPKDKYTLFETP